MQILILKEHILKYNECIRQTRTYDKKIWMLKDIKELKNKLTPFYCIDHVHCIHTNGSYKLCKNLCKSLLFVPIL